jgi:hypothetical protein
MIFVFEPNFHNLKKIKIDVIYIACCNVVVIRFDMFQFHTSIIGNLVFPFFYVPPHLTIFHKTKIKVFLGFYFFNGFWIQFPNMIPNVSTLCGTKV